MMMFETSKHVPKTEKRCCVFENNHFHFRIYWGISYKCLVSRSVLRTLCMCSLVFVAVSEVQMSRQTKLEIA